MAYSRNSTTSSGYFSSKPNTPTTPLNSHYLCYWHPTCNGQHELNQCEYWENELRGKLGMYYSHQGIYKLFERDQLSTCNLEYNNTGCTRVNLLVYNIEMKEVLFGLKWCKERRSDRQKRLLLAFPSAQPCRRSERMLRIPSRAFEWLTTDTEFANQCLKHNLKNRFIFHDANVVYPVLLTNEQALKLTNEFHRNEEFQTLHWFSLSEILSQLPTWSNEIKEEETASELAQIQYKRPEGIKLKEYELWHVTVTSFMCIRDYVPGDFQTFLKI